MKNETFEELKLTSKSNVAHILMQYNDSKIISNCYLQNKVQYPEDYSFVFSKNDKIFFNENLPSGPIVVTLFSDIVDSCGKWEKNPKIMKKYLKEHDEIMLEFIKKHEGKEVKRNGDSFMIVFQYPKNAYHFAVDVLIKFNSEESKAYFQVSKDHPIKIGMYNGKTWLKYNLETDSFDYLGESPNKASRLEGNAKGGMILFGGCKAVEIKQFKEQLKENLYFEQVKNVTLRGMEEENDPIICITLKQIETKDLENIFFSYIDSLRLEIDILKRENKKLKEKIDHLERLLCAFTEVSPPKKAKIEK